MDKACIKIMILAPDLPFPIRAGGHVRMVSIIEGLSRFGWIHVACVTPQIDEATRVWSQRIGGTIVNYAPRTPSGVKLWLDRAWAVLRKDSLRFCNDENEFFEKAFSVCKPDLVWLETPYLLRYALVWRNRTPLVVDCWGTSLGQQRDWHNARGYRKIWEWLRWRSIHGAEIRYLPLLTDIVTVSEFEADFLRRLAPGSRVRVIPLCINSAGRPSAFKSVEDPNGLIFTGDMSFRPNVDAAIYFVKEILPKIRRIHPKARLVLAGRNPSEKLRRLASPHVTVTGYLPDLSGVVASAAVYVLPMRLGSGVRTKLMDAFLLGKALVTTAIGAEGLELQHSQNCLIADTPEAFARACIELLEDAGQRRRLGTNLKRMATKMYSQQNIEALLQRMLTDILGRDVNVKR